MSTSLSNTGPSAHAFEARKRLERLSAYSPDQLTDAMMWLAGCDPGTFEAVLDAAEMCTGDLPEEPEPVCGRCGADIGIFLKLGLDWHHYRGMALGEAQLFDPGHTPELAWRFPAATAL
jgi:hypothetical protein